MPPTELPPPTDFAMVKLLWGLVLVPFEMLRRRMSSQQRSIDFINVNASKTKESLARLETHMEHHRTDVTEIKDTLKTMQWQMGQRRKED